MAEKVEKLYRIEENFTCGRQLVANRDILAGELIIDEPALLTGPGYAGAEVNGNAGDINAKNSSDIGGHHVCLVCSVNLGSKTFECCKCSLLLCSEFCQSHNQHADNECLIFPKIRHVWDQGRGRSRKSLYNLIITIRGLFYKFRDGRKWEQIKMLESKAEALEKAGAFCALQDVFNSLSWDMFSEINGNSDSGGETANSDKDVENIVEAAQHCLGVMRINAFSNFSETYSREGLFFLSSLMPHRCFINTDRQIEPGIAGYEIATDTGHDVSSSRMVVRASVNIEKDAPITTTYLSLLYNKEERHRIMLRYWLFLCDCQRCRDPTELNTFAAGIKCHCESDSFHGSQDNPSSTESVNCDSCKSRAEAISIPQIIKSRPRNINDVQKLENWLDQYDNGEILHTNHSVFTHVKLFLCQYLGRQVGGLEKLSADELKRKVLYCKQLLEIYDKVAPGYQMCRGVILFELWNGLARLDELRQLPFTTQCPEISFDASHISEVKKEALQALKYALPKSSEEAMMTVLKGDETSSSADADLN